MEIMSSINSCHLLMMLHVRGIFFSLLCTSASAEVVPEPHALGPQPATRTAPYGPSYGHGGPNSSEYNPFVPGVTCAYGGLPSRHPINMHMRRRGGADRERGDGSKHPQRPNGGVGAVKRVRGTRPPRRCFARRHRAPRAAGLAASCHASVDGKPGCVQHTAAPYPMFSRTSAKQPRWPCGSRGCRWTGRLCTGELQAAACVGGYAKVYCMHTQVKCALL